MSYRNAWSDERYLHKKQLALQQEVNRQNDEIVWAGRVSVREIMPDCVLKFVRNLYPNLPQYTYMGHKWH